MGNSYYEDGIRYEKHTVYSGLLGIISGEAWYPVAEDDPDRFFLLTLLGGPLGLHKFKSGQIVAGILYFLTFGGLGVLYITDLLSLLFGTYHLKQTVYTEDEQGQLQKRTRRIYMGKPKRAPGKLMITVLAVFFTYFAVRFGYIRFMGKAYAQMAKAAYEKIIEFSETAEDSLNRTALRFEEER